MINVKNDWKWVKNHVQQSIMKDEQLRKDYFKIAKKYEIKPIFIMEMYQDAIRYGEKNGKYLNFKNWFYRFYFNIENINESIND